MPPGAQAARRAHRRRRRTQIAALAARRLAGEPVARIVGAKEFWGLPLAVTPTVLVPRPETETVVELALALLDRDGRARARCASPISAPARARSCSRCFRELPNAHGVGTDIDRDALAVARTNAAALGLADRASFVACDYGAALAGRFDLVVANPPYVASGDIAALAPEVRDHDPRRALDGGADGLAAYRAIAADAPRLLAPDGHLVVEIGAGQQRDVEFLFAQAGPCNRGRRGTTCRASRGRSSPATPRIGGITDAPAAAEEPKNRLECRKRPTRVAFTESIPDWVTHCHRGPERGSVRRQVQTGRMRKFPLRGNDTSPIGIRDAFTG